MLIFRNQAVKTELGQNISSNLQSHTTGTYENFSMYEYMGK